MAEVLAKDLAATRVTELANLDNILNKINRYRKNTIFEMTR